MNVLNYISKYFYGIGLKQKSFYVTTAPPRKRIRFYGSVFYFCVVEMKGTSHPWGMLCMPPRCTLAQTREYKKHGRIAKRFSGDRPFPCALSFALFRLPIWRVLETARRSRAARLFKHPPQCQLQVIFNTLEFLNYIWYTSGMRIHLIFG